MAETALLAARPISRRPALLAALTLGIAVALFLRGFTAGLPPEQWWPALTGPDPAAIPQILAHYSLLPRFVVGLLAGAALGLAGVLFQQVLRNPLAEPGTLGVFAGAKLALAAAMLGGGGLTTFGQGSIVLLGGSASLLLVLALSWRRRLAPLAVILSGLVVTLFLDAVTRMLVLFNHGVLADLFLWQAGSLSQNNWGSVLYLAPRLALAAVFTLVLLRPLTLLDLDEAGARSLGLPLAATRLLALGLAVLLSAFVVSAVGVVGFIGLAGPAIARHAGARRFRDRLLWGPLLSAGLLLLTDQLLQLGGVGRLLPAGALTAILGAPLLLWLLGRLRPGGGPPAGALLLSAARLARPWAWIGGGLLLLVPLIWVALAFGPVPDGWRWSSGEELELLLPWRAPRVAAALGAGFMLGLAGVLLQRLTGNPLASPELLGISSGAALALILVAFLAPWLERPMMILAATAGAGLALLAILALGRRSGYAPEHLLLAGVALATIQSSVMVVILVGGDPRTVQLLSWLAGSTYGLTGRDAAFTCGLALLLALLVPLSARWLEILPLGTPVGRALGLSPARSRLLLLLLTALLTAAATLTVGPLGFVGLMAPHLARLLGIQRPTPQLFAAGLLGAGIMVTADWLGRVIAFPWQIPAGLVATVIGGCYFVWLMRRR